MNKDKLTNKKYGKLRDEVLKLNLAYLFDLKDFINTIIKYELIGKGVLK